MPLDKDPEFRARAGVATARETLKAFARAELGLEIGGLPSLEALAIVLAGVITKLKDQELRKP